MKATFSAMKQEQCQQFFVKQSSITKLFRKQKRIKCFYPLFPKKIISHHSKSIPNFFPAPLRGESQKKSICCMAVSLDCKPGFFSRHDFYKSANGSSDFDEITTIRFVWMQGVQKYQKFWRKPDSWGPTTTFLGIMPIFQLSPIELKIEIWGVSRS